MGLGVHYFQTHPHIPYISGDFFPQERHVAASAVQNEAAKVARAGQLGQRVYPLVNIQKAMENHHF